MKQFIIKYKSYIIGGVLGAVAGFLYWRFVGCTSGSCPITSKWYTTAVYGMLMGLLLGNPSKKSEKNTRVEKVENLDQN